MTSLRAPRTRVLDVAIMAILAGTAVDARAQSADAPETGDPREALATERARANIVTRAVLLTVGGPAAHSEPPPTTSPTDLTRVVPTPTAGEAPEAQAPYRDRLIAPDRLEPLPPDEDEVQATEGLPRSLRVDLLASRNERGEERFDEHGVRLGAFWQTEGLGNFSFDATAFRGDRPRGDDDGWSGSATLWQRGLPMAGGWSVDNGLGVLNTPTVPLLREQYRFFLPAVSYAGASTGWRNAERGLDLQAGLGRAGLYSGSRVVGFELADGDVATLGAQWRWAPGWTGAATVLVTDGRLVPDADGSVPDFPEAELEDGRTRALHLTTARSTEAGGLQFNLLRSDGDGLDDAIGAWADYTLRRGRFRHNAGLFRLEPDLAWGALPINSNVAGGYYRLNYQYARWSWTAGLDRLQPVEGDGLDGWYATGYARYQATTTLGYGASVNLRRTPDTAHSLQLFLDKRTGWGQTRLQIDQARTGQDNDSWLLTVDQDLPLKQGRRLAVSASYGSIAQEDDGRTRTASVALYGSADLTDNVSLDGTLRWTDADGPGALRGSDVNLGLNWRLSRDWRLVAAWYESRGSQRSPFVIDPLANEQPFVRLPRDRAFTLSLQFQRNAGRPQAVIGGAPGAASGTVAGSVFLDDNDDGVRSASEQAAANLTVILDGRWSVRTDSLGRFEFPRVAVGTHTLTVLPDNLPLPWYIDDAAATRTFEVQVRDTVQLDVGARRPR